MPRSDQDDNLFVMDDDEQGEIKTEGPEGPDFLLTPEDQAEIQRLYDLDSASGGSPSVAGREDRPAVPYTGVCGADGGTERPRDPNQRPVPPGGIMAQQVFMFLVKGAMKRISSVVVVNEAKGIAISINGGFSGKTDTRIKSRSLIRGPLDEALGTDLMRVGGKTSCFARFICLNPDLGLLVCTSFRGELANHVGNSTGPNNFDITVDKFIGSTEIKVVTIPLPYYGRIPTDPRTGKRADLLMENCNGLFLVPVGRTNSDRQRCKLVRQKRTLNTKPFTLGDKLAIRAQNWALAPTNFEYITMFGEGAPFAGASGGGGGGEDGGGNDDDDDHRDDVDGGGGDDGPATGHRQIDHKHDSDVGSRRRAEHPPPAKHLSQQQQYQWEQTQEYRQLHSSSPTKI